MKKIALRIDDIGASTKKFEVYSKLRLGNFLFLKYLKPFKAWGPYNELGPDEWKKIIEITKNNSVKLTVAITSGWVERSGKIIPFNEKYPNQAEILKDAFEKGIIDIANHGYTHCVVGKHLPRLFSSNRRFHREFHDWLPYSAHELNIKESQKIFKKWLGVSPTLLVPPGNVFSEKTIKAGLKNGITNINCMNINNISDPDMKIIDNEKIDAFHDKEIREFGIEWYEKKIYKLRNFSFEFVKDLFD